MTARAVSVAPVGDTPASHLRNALQVLAGVADQERAIGYQVEGEPCYAITGQELAALRKRIDAAVTDLELDAAERRGVMAFMESRA